jgi:hypothetical protein
MKCVCGNTPVGQGFFPCLRSGQLVDPTPEAWVDGYLYRCDRCGQIIDGETLQVVGRAELSIDEQWENLKTRIRAIRCSNAACRKLRRALHEMSDSLGKFARLAAKRKKDPRSVSMSEVRNALKEANASIDRVNEC